MKVFAGGPAGTAGQAVVTPGRVLAALRSELAERGVTVSGITITRLEGTLILLGGPVVRYRHGWLVWPAGRASQRGRPLFTVHSAGDPAGAARRLTHPSSTAGGPTVAWHHAAAGGFGVKPDVCGTDTPPQ